MEDRRLVYARKWVKRGQSEKDPFDEFICLWFGLAIFAKYGVGMHFYHSSDKSLDRCNVIGCFEHYREEIHEVVNEEKVNICWLAEREATPRANTNAMNTDQSPILFSGDREIKESRNRLKEHWIGNSDLDDHVEIESMALLLNQIRNNLFHGGKVYDDQGDLELLQHVNPILETILVKIL